MQVSPCFNITISVEIGENFCVLNCVVNSFPKTLQNNDKMADEIDSRMEAIKLKNEALENKHKEILQDEMEARKMGAVVETKQITSQKETHPYDHVELDFDVKDEQRELAKNPDYKPKSESCCKNTVCTTFSLFHCISRPLLIPHTS
jgi:hypothetical protein